MLSEHSLLIQHRTEHQQHHSQWLRINQPSEGLWAHCQAHFFTLRQTVPDEESPYAHDRSFLKSEWQSQNLFYPKPNKSLFLQRPSSRITP